MDFQRGKHREELEINLIPMIDVLLVLLIFLIVTTTFSRISELQINLPTAEANVPQDKPAHINIGVDTTGRYTVNNVIMSERTVEALTLALRKAAGGAKEPTIIINADSNTTHQSVINVMEASRQAGYTHITFATQNKSGS